MIDIASRGMRWVVSAFTTASWSDGRIQITSATSGAMFVTGDLDLLRLVHAFAQPRTIAEVLAELSASAPEQTAANIDNLIRGGVLTPASEPEAATTHHWDWSALAFHRRSRQHGFHKAPRPEASAVARRQSPNAIPLGRRSGKTGRDFADVLDTRRSWRAWPAAAIGFEAFSSFLWLSARARAMSEEAALHETATRPYPSGGAAYSLEIYPVIASCGVGSIAAGIFRYLPECHCLEPVSESSADYLPFLEAAGRSAGSAMPPVLLIITSRFARQSESYGNLAYSLVLKEVGCLFQTLYLVAEYLDLAACALGGGMPAGRLARLCHTSEIAEPVVGEFMLGPR